MAKARILQSFQPPKERLQGLAWAGGEIWIVSTKAKQILRGKTTGRMASTCQCGEGKCAKMQ